MRVQRAIVWELATKELRLFFGSPLAYLVMGAFLGLTLFTFFWVEAFFARNISDVRPMFEGLPVLLIAIVCPCSIFQGRRSQGAPPAVPQFYVMSDKLPPKAWGA